MTQELSIWALILGATLPVKLVMLILFGASMVSWVMIVQRGLFLRRAGTDLKHFEGTFWSGIDLNQLFNDGNLRLQSNRPVPGVEAVFRAGFREFNRLGQQAGAEPDAVIAGVERAMRVALSREEEKLNTHLAFLASVASVSPYIGLFGTVWGIMNSFRGLANVHQATLASVAPGIAEALVATAIGLFAAIPAVVAYNRFAYDMDRLSTRFDSFIDEFSNILQRQAR